MATQHVSATISGQASAAIFGQTFAEAIRDNLSAHAAWELVEEYDPGSVVKHYVFKCLSTSSGLPADFFLVMTRVLSTGVLQFYIGEGYNSGTHVLSLFPTGNSSGISNTSTYAYDSSGRQTPHTYTLTTAALTGTSNTPVYRTWTPASTGCSYNMIIYDDGMVFITYGNVIAWYHCGAYTWLGVPSNSMPVCQCGSASSMSTPDVVTRNPLAASATKGHWWCRCETLSSISSDSILGVSGGDPDWKDALQSSKSPVAELLVLLNSDRTTQAGVNTSDVMGRVAGKLKHTRYITGQPSSAVFGDSYKMDGTLWVADKVGSSSVILWDTGVPE